MTNHTSNLQSTPLTSTLGLLYLIGWTASAIGLRQLRAAGSRAFATAVFLIQMVGLGLAACQQLGELSHHLPPPDSRIFMAMDMAWPLRHIYMICVGICVLDARVFSGWRRFTTVACGLALPLSMLGQAIGGRSAMEVSFGVLTTLSFASLGYAVRSYSPWDNKGGGDGSRSQAVSNMRQIAAGKGEEALKMKRILQPIVLILLSAATSAAQVAPTTIETGTFRLHKFEQPIGEETYTTTRQGDVLHLDTDFKFTDRSTPVPLKARAHLAPDYTPQSFTIKGNTSRSSEIDAEVTVIGTDARVRDGKKIETLALPGRFFTISGYAPVAIEQALMRYWKGHGSPAKLPTLPSGEVEITDRGSETINIDGEQAKVERYSVKGLVWGLESLWMDAHNNLVALVTRDAEFDHFEAVSDHYEPALAQFVASAARDEMAELTELSQHLPGRTTGNFAFMGATLIDGTGGAPIANATVLTSGGKIVAVGPAASIQVPPDATRIDVPGKYIIPGLWDMHAHYEQVEWGPIYLAAGVTTVRDVGNEFDFITSIRDAVNRGAGIGPHLLLAGIVDGDGPTALATQRVNSSADAARWVRKYHDAGFQQMKIYSSVTPENVKAICIEAHRLGMTVTGHIPRGMDVYEGVNDGMDQVNHLHFLLRPLMPKDFDPKTATPEQREQARAAVDINSPAGRQLVQFLKDHKIVIDDTLSLLESSLRPSTQAPTDVEPGIAKVAPELREQFQTPGVPPEGAARAKIQRQKLLDILSALHRAGVTIVAGTDQNVPGYSVYRELELYVEAGFTPLEALQAATIVPARVMKVDSESGTVAPGKRADFDILDANPLDDIHNIRTIHRVVANGVLYDTAPLWKSVGFTP